MTLKLRIRRPDPLVKQIAKALEECDTAREGFLGHGEVSALARGARHNSLTGNPLPGKGAAVVWKQLAGDRDRPFSGDCSMGNEGVDRQQQKVREFMNL